MRRRAFRASALVFAVGLGSCAPGPAPVAPPPPTPTPAPAATPAPTPTPAPVLPEVKAPALDVAIGIDRPSAAFPAGDWLLRAGEKTECRRGPLVFRPAPAIGAVVVEENGTF